MVVLLSAAMLVVAAVLLVLQLVQGGGFGRVYGAIVLALLSMVVLQLAKWMGSRPEARSSAAPTPLPEPLAEEPPTVAEALEQTARRGDPARARRAAEAPDPTPDRGPEPAPADDGLEPEPEFPIADYDGLWVSQVLPLLPKLYDDELAVVDARERGGRHRPAILDAIAELRAEARRSGAPSHAPSADDAAWAPADEPAPTAGDGGAATAPVSAEGSAVAAALAAKVDPSIEPAGRGRDDRSSVAPGDADHPSAADPDPDPADRADDPSPSEADGPDQADGAADALRGAVAGAEPDAVGPPVGADERVPGGGVSDGDVADPAAEPDPAPSDDPARTDEAASAPGGSEDRDDDRDGPPAPPAAPRGRPAPVVLAWAAARARPAGERVDRALPPGESRDRTFARTPAVPMQVEIGADPA